MTDNKALFTELVRSGISNSELAKKFSEGISEVEVLSLHDHLSVRIRLIRDRDSWRRRQDRGGYCRQR